MVASIISHVALNATQKMVANASIKVATTAGGTLAGCLVQDKIVKSKSKKIVNDFQEKTANGEVVTQEDLQKAMMPVYVQAAFASGACAGAGSLVGSALTRAVNRM